MNQSNISPWYGSPGAESSDGSSTSLEKVWTAAVIVPAGFTCAATACTQDIIAIAAKPTTVNRRGAYLQARIIALVSPERTDEARGVYDGGFQWRWQAAK